jgi:hypothetical protein
VRTSNPTVTYLLEGISVSFFSAEMAKRKQHTQFFFNVHTVKLSVVSVLIFLSVPVGKKASKVVPELN